MPTLAGELILTNVEQVVAEAIASLADAIERSGAVVTYAPLARVNADPAELRQIFRTLISNAVEFHGSRPPRVHIACRRTSLETVFAVADHGAGIARGRLQRIFVASLQAPRADSNQPHAPIGLGMCKRLVEHHGGRIWVESQPGVGSIFYFTVPHPGRA